MQLQQVEGVGRQDLQAAFDEGGNVRPAVTARFMRVKAAAGFGRDVEWLRPFFAELREQPLAATVPIDVRGIEEIDSEIQGPVERGE